MSTGQTTFGENPGFNFYNFSGNATDWTNWNNASYTSGMLGRIVLLAAYWACHTGFTCSNGHNDLWNWNTTNLALSTGNFAPGTGGNSVGSQSWHNNGTADGWQGPSDPWALGFWRPSTGSNEFSVNSGSNLWAAKNADDGNKGGGTLHPYGNAGKIGAYGTVQNTEIYVMRGGSWTRTNVYVMRGGSWTVCITWIWRSGGWTTVAEYLRTTKQGIPRTGLPIWICEDGKPMCPRCERALLIETGELGWFGSVDATKLGFDWRQAGSFRRFWGGASHASTDSVRRNSAQTQETIERLEEARALMRLDLKAGFEPATVARLWQASQEGQAIDGRLPGFQAARDPYSALARHLRTPGRLNPVPIDIFRVALDLAPCGSCP